MKLFETVTKENVYKTFQITFNDLKVRDKPFQIQVGEKIWNDLNQQRNLYHDILGESLVQMVAEYKRQQTEIQEGDTNFKLNPVYVYANIMECIFNGVSDTLVFNKMMNEVISWLAYVEILNAAAGKRVKV
jgi:major membrane immunogen (membrane-anchored lipoprotein)